MKELQEYQLVDNSFVSNHFSRVFTLRELGDCRSRVYVLSTILEAIIIGMLREL
jgi:hypothetical protein